MKARMLKLVLMWMVILGIAEVRAAEARISSAFLARGENTVLEVLVTGGLPDQLPMMPEVKGVDIVLLGRGTPRGNPGGQIVYSIEYVLSSYEAGVHEIPEIEVEQAGVKTKTKPFRIEVFDPSDLTWGEGKSVPERIGETIPYASIIKVPEGKFFENQTVETEMKIYVPRDMARTVVDWGSPQYESDGLAVWRFEVKEGRGEVNLLGQSYISISYGTTMTSLRSGKVTAGPANVRLTYVKMIFERFTQRAELQVTLDVGKKDLEVLPLPEGAPEGFDQVVGEFVIGTGVTQTEVVEGEPIAVDVIVSGRGNLDLIRPPKLIDEEGWKVYESTQNQRGEERVELSGTVIFKQFLRPMELKTAIPPFRLVYFDPKLEQYKTVMTEPIALQMKPAASGGLEVSGIPQTLSVPVERMTDILGLVGTGNLVSGRGWVLPWWSLHVFGGLMALGLVARALWMRYGHLLEKDETKLRMKKDFEKVLGARGGDGLEFLRVAGGFVEKWMGGVEDEALRKVLDERDEMCFRPEREGVRLMPERMREIVQVLKRGAFGVLMFGLMMCGVGSLEARDLGAEAKGLYESAKYEEAAEMWLGAGPFEDLSADTMYNIGNAAYRMGVPGEAALYYRRALARDASHEEARQNLRFLERKYGSITIERPAFQYALAKFPLPGWKSVFWGGLWMVGLGLLVFPATSAMARTRVWAVVGLILGPLMVSVGGLGWYYFPDDAKFAPMEMQAVIVADNVVLHTDAARTSPAVIDAPAGSLAEVIRVSGKWAYVGFATKTRGWVPVEYIGMILPKEKPEVPKVRKAVGDGSSA